MSCVQIFSLIGFNKNWFTIPYKTAQKPLLAHMLMIFCCKYKSLQCFKNLSLFEVILQR